MFMVWLVPVTLLALGAGVFAFARRGRKNGIAFPQEPVSGQWLAEKRSREEHHW